MRKRKALAMALIAVGLVLIVGSFGAFALHSTPPSNLALLASVGVLVLVVGLIILITEIIETLLGRGQTALVDGLQAG